MRLGDSPRLAARWAAGVLIVGGLVGLLINHVLQPAGPANDYIALADAAVGALIWVLPWHRWPSRATVAIVPVGLVLLAVSRAVGSVLPASYSVAFVMVFLWVGLTQPPRTSFWLAPAAGAAYLLPGLFVGGDPAQVNALPVVLPICLLAAELPAGMLAQLRALAATEREEKTAFAEAAHHDDLTGLGNRRRSNVLLDRLRPGDALLLLDLDHFKEVNDRHGHAAGDVLLMELGQYLREAVRDADAVARYGGEEFIVVLRGAGRTALEAAQRLIVGWRSRNPLATFSVGVAVHQFRQSPSVTFREADAALYQAKDSGRDRVALRGSPALPVV